jgi:hypothetical protein
MALLLSICTARHQTLFGLYLFRRFTETRNLFGDPVHICDVFIINTTVLSLIHNSCWKLYPQTLNAFHRNVTNSLTHSEFHRVWFREYNSDVNPKASTMCGLFLRPVFWISFIPWKYLRVPALSFLHCVRVHSSAGNISDLFILQLELQNLVQLQFYIKCIMTKMWSVLCFKHLNRTVYQHIWLFNGF